MIRWNEPDRRLEASGDSATRAAQDANRAAQEVLAERNAQERAAVQQLVVRLESLKKRLLDRILTGGTDFQMATVRQMARDVDRMIQDATAAIAVDAEKTFEKQAELGDMAGVTAMRAAKIVVVKTTPGLDPHLVQSAFDNTVDLLTMPMQQFGADVKVAIRRVALTSDSQMGEIQKLRDKIAGQGFDAAQYRAERIIRTEVGRVFNDANYSRLLALGKDFAFLRKAWRAASDRRTRLGHKEAAATYGRGKGIPIHAGFVLNVYDERNGKAVRLVGQASLRFPLDPQASPAGRIAAGATIMCRCNAFVDFDLVDLRRHQRDQLRIALPPAAAPLPPAPPVVPQPAPGIPKVKTTTKPRVRTPKVATPSGKDVLPQLGGGAGAAVPGAMVPAGKPVSESIELAPAAVFDKWRRLKREGKDWQVKAKKIAQQALAMIDSVHGDGNLGQIKMRALFGGGSYGYYQPGGMSSDRADHLGIKQDTVNFNTVFHETGHWLDHIVVAKRGTTVAGFREDHLTKSNGLTGNEFSSQDPYNEAMRRLREAMNNSQAITRMTQWQKSQVMNPNSTMKIATPHGFEGDGQTPLGVDRYHLQYLLTGRENFARAYAQYIAVKAGGPALEELKALQAVTKATAEGRPPAIFGGGAKQMVIDKLDGNTFWTYLNVWQEADFVPIEKAFDDLFERMGWRVPKPVTGRKGGE